MADNILLQSFLKTAGGGLQFYGVVPYDPILGGGVAAALRPADTELAAQLNKVIDAMVVSDFFKNLSNRYFGTNISPVNEQAAN
jgi:polar amino acid transport system substrate-binding protein